MSPLPAMAIPTCCACPVVQDQLTGCPLLEKISFVLHHPAWNPWLLRTLQEADVTQKDATCYAPNAKPSEHVGFSKQPCPVPCVALISIALQPTGWVSLLALCRCLINQGCRPCSPLTGFPCWLPTGKLSPLMQTMSWLKFCAEHQVWGAGLSLVRQSVLLCSVLKTLFLTQLAFCFLMYQVFLHSLFSSQL